MIFCEGMNRREAIAIIVTSHAPFFLLWCCMYLCFDPVCLKLKVFKSLRNQSNLHFVRVFLLLEVKLMQRQHEQSTNTVLFADQFWLFGVHSHYHILIRGWQQVAYAFLWNRKLLLAIIILNERRAVNTECETNKQNGEEGVAGNKRKTIGKFER